MTKDARNVLIFGYASFLAASQSLLARIKNSDVDSGVVQSSAWQPSRSGRTRSLCSTAALLASDSPHLWLVRSRADLYELKLTRRLQVFLNSGSP